MTELVEHVERPMPVAADTDSWVTVVAEVAKLAAHICDTDFVPASFRGNPAAATAAILYGREVGLPPMTSLTQIYVQKGRPAMYAEAMRALILAAGHEYEVRAATGREATVAGRRRGTTRWQEVVWNLDMARAAGLVKRDSAWESYPRAMLVAKATAELARQMFPDVIHGLVALEDIDDTPPPETLTTAPEPAAAKTTVQRNRGRAGTRKTADKATTPPPTPPADTAPPSLPLPGETDGPGADALTTRTGAGSATRAEPGSTSTTPTPVTPSATSGVPVEVEPPDSSATIEPGKPVAEEEVAPAPGPEPELGSADPDDDGLFEVDGTLEEDTPDPDDDVPAGDPQLDTPARRVDIVRLVLDFERLGVDDRDHRIAYIATLTGRDIESSAQLTRREAHTMIETLAMCKTRDDLDDVAGATEAHRWEQQQLGGDQ